MARSQWWKSGFLNVLEHGITRLGDALASLLLIWVLSPEIFARLALAQAWVAPLLLFFLTPETIFYRDYGLWCAEGRSRLSFRLRALRLFGWGKGFLAVAASLLIAVFTQTESTALTFWSVLWAFSLALGPQIAGPDREFLRFSLKLRELNLLTSVQKLGTLSVTALAVFLFPGQIWILSLSTIAVVSGATLLARYWADRALLHVEESGRSAADLTTTGVLREALASFSLWGHVQGVIYGWVQTMDLLFLGWTAAPAATIGLYGSVSKLANFAFALPTALGNVFGVWLGRRISEDATDRRLERQRVRSWSSRLLLVGLAQTGILIAIAPWLLNILSRGRWSPDEIAQMLGWFHYKLIGTLGWIAAMIMSAWLSARGFIRPLLFQVTVPWALICLIGFGVGALQLGPQGAAQANLLAAGSLLGLCAWLFYRKR